RVDRAPESDIPVPFEAEIAPVGKLEHRAVGVGLKVETEGNIEPANTKVETSHVLTAQFVAQQRVEDVVQVQVDVVVLERPARPTLALHIVGHGNKAVAAHQPPLDVEAGEGRGGRRELLECLEAHGLAADRMAWSARTELRHDFLAE